MAPLLVCSKFYIIASDEQLSCDAGGCPSENTSFHKYHKQRELSYEHPGDVESNAITDQNNYHIGYTAIKIKLFWWISQTWYLSQLHHIRTLLTIMANARENPNNIILLVRYFYLVMHQNGKYNNQWKIWLGCFFIYRIYSPFSKNICTNSSVTENKNNLVAIHQW